MSKNLKYVAQSNGGSPHISFPPEQSSQPAVNGKRTRILIVEDEPAMVAGLRDNLNMKVMK